VRRQGSAHANVTVYTLTPPASAERLLHIERRLAAKLGIAHGVIGAGLSPIAAPQDGAAAELGRITHILARWRADSGTPEGAAHPTIAAVRAHALPRPGLLAILAHAGDAPVLIADLGRGLTTDATTVRRALECMDGDAVSPDSRALVEAQCGIQAWWAYHRGARAVDRATAASARVRHLAGERLEALRRRVPRHQRGAMAPRITAARRVLSAAISQSAEERLAALASAPLDDDAWLRAVADLDARHRSAIAAPEPAAPPLLALVLLEPICHSTCARTPHLANSFTETPDT
jgi:hypothetical protein